MSKTKKFTTLVFVFIILISLTPILAAVDVVGLWHFDEGTGNIAYDSSGNGNDGTIYGATWVDGKLGKALDFDGLNDYVEVPYDSSLQPTRITIEAWVYPESLPLELKGVVHDNDGSYNLATYGTSIRVELKINGVWRCYDWGALNTGVWQHLVATYDGTTIKLYKNGALVNSASHSGNIDSSTNPTRIGGKWYDGRYFDGIIDEVYVYDGALSADEVLARYNNPHDAVSYPEFPFAMAIVTSLGLCGYLLLRRKFRFTK